MKQSNPKVCEDCRGMAKERGKSIKCQDCDLGPPPLLDRNSVVVGLLNDFGSGLFDGYGNINSASVEAVLNIMGVESQDKIWLLNRLIFFAKEYGKQNRATNKGR